MPRVSALHIYPIKGCAGIEVGGIRLDPLGPLLDRRYMVVDADGNFVSQRQVPRMALVRPKLAPTSLVLTATGMQKLAVPLSSRSQARRPVTVWGDKLNAESVGRDAAEWLSEFLELPCELVRFADEAVRNVDPRYAASESRIGFADGFPVLLISEASLAALNGRLATPVPMDRFRPNLVVTDTAAHDEDTWRAVRIGDVAVDVVKPCSRCTVPTVDQRTGERGTEPMATLARYRTRDHKVYFGQNCLHRELGMIRVGDEIEVLQKQAALSFEE